MVATTDTPLAQIRDLQGTAFVFEGQAITFAEFGDRIAATARALSAYGVRRGDRVGFCGLNRVETFDLYLACAEIGAIFVPLNNRLTATELGWHVDHCRPRIVVVSDGFGDRFEATGGVPIVDSETEPLNGTDTSTSANTDTGAKPDPDPRSEPMARPQQPGKPGPSWLDRDLLMVYTSGTTGEPKGAVHTGRSIHYTVLNGVATQQIKAGDYVVSALPTFHVGGLNIQVLPALLVGATVELVRRFDPAQTLAALVEGPATHTVLVPAMLKAVAACPDFSTADLSGLKAVTTGSSTIPEAAVRPFVDRGLPVAQVYGATETGPTAIALPFESGLEHPTLAGAPAPHTEVRIVNTDSGVDTEPGTHGEVWLRGPNLFDRYWNAPAATDSAFVDGWYRSGDFGRWHESGFVEVTDRLDDVIISGGENIAAAEVEAVLGEHPDVVEVAVIGRPDDRWGQTPVAYIVSPDPPSLSDLRTWAEQRLARYKLPTELIAVDELPKTALGKVRKHHI